ncbi:pyrimidine-nucleoside phosphorylase [Thermoflexus sp.]|uniref:pyrimidine-nucleoside phosphorylase n=1 Tax=Thermoflexus sp. TaxID=1969742 RepID=UPI0025E04AAA|nr:pyrimidine-nucleoside phosphorylase [Thermoflexus sp.]MCS7350672.1 pyrimidine-nucleoside phosphorylase [Thermoflexus sp.]MCX7690642.1 pyrimidine-nucleoside phosphorylase [Thermoflexus sp.]MDW8180123.1 pyrimidine-nucleoside phosphorylase [Anaerolineae bacterium]
MRAVDIIEKKRDGGELTPEEIRFFVEGFTRGEIPDYQAAAFLMAVYFQGMTPRETAELTLAMAYSGQVLDLHDIAPVVVDKHSTGGVGDKVSLVVVPLVAAAGLPVGKMSGRGLSFTGGTIDKLESIRGLRVELTVEEFREQLRRVGAVLCGQSADLAPADGKFYALRDVTGTVPSIPLIAASIMSKKIAGGADAIVLDVKVGNGAFMKTLDQARALARQMVDIGTALNRRVVAVISDMNQPLGEAVGNALEVKEAIATLRDDGPADFREHCLTIAAHMLHLGGRVRHLEEARRLAEATLASGAAWEKFRALVAAQGGDIRQIEDPEQLPRARLIREIPAPAEGYLAEVRAYEIGMASVALGAGRTKKGEPVDPAVGIIVHRKAGDFVRRGEPLFTVHANEEGRLAEAERWLARAVRIQEAPVSPRPHIYEILSNVSDHPGQ